MLLLKKKEITDNKISYYYQPEFKGEMGIITYSRITKKFEIEKFAEFDYKTPNCFQRHAFEKILTFVFSGKFPDEKRFIGDYSYRVNKLFQYKKQT